MSSVDNVAKSLTNSNLVTNLDSESRRAVGGKVLVSLLVSSVLGNAVINVSIKPDAVSLTVAPLH